MTQETDNKFIKYTEVTFDNKCKDCGMINEVKIDIVDNKYIFDLIARAETSEARVQEFEKAVEVWEQAIVREEKRARTAEAKLASMKVLSVEDFEDIINTLEQRDPLFTYHDLAKAIHKAIFGEVTNGSV